MARILAYMTDCFNKMTKRAIEKDLNGKKVKAATVAVNKIKTTTMTVKEERMITKVIKEKLNDEKSTTRLKIRNNDKIVGDDFEHNGERLRLDCIYDNSPLSLGFENLCSTISLLSPSISS